MFSLSKTFSLSITPSLPDIRSVRFGYGCRGPEHELQYYTRHKAGHDLGRTPGFKELHKATSQKGKKISKSNSPYLPPDFLISVSTQDLFCIVSAIQQLTHAMSSRRVRPQLDVTYGFWLKDFSDIAHLLPLTYWLVSVPDVTPRCNSLRSNWPPMCVI